jgi:two-component system sensor histidine kinase VicK
MIMASLLVVAAIISLLYTKQSQLHREKVRTQGVALARALSGTQLSQLVPAAGQKNLVGTFASAQASDAFAYAALVTKSGEKLYEFTAPGSIVPSASLPLDPSAWFGEHPLVSPGDGKPIREFFAPVLQKGELVGFVRIGYYETLEAARILEISYTALMALPVLLLMAFCYFLIKQEMRPLAALTRKLEEVSRTYGLQLGFPTNLELRQLARRFDDFVQAVLGRVREADRQTLEMQAASRLLAYKHDKAHAILNAIPDAVVVLDDSGVLSYANPKAAALLGAEPDALLGKPLQAWCPRADVRALLGRINDPVDAHAYSTELEYSMAEDRERRMCVSAYPLFSPRDARIVYGTLAVFRDVSEQYSAKHAGMEFVAQVSHELKTPLTTMRTFSELLLDYAKLSAEDRVEAVNGIHDETARVATLITNLLNVFKLEAGTLPLERQRVKLHELLSDVARSMAKSAQSKQVALELRIAPDIGAASLDKELFRIAVDNLVGNAIKYSRPGGRVTLAAERANEHVRITVSDDGIGIAEDETEKVFDKYYRSKSQEVAARTGHGLGLYLAKRIVELHHASISVQSELGKGTQFALEFEATAVPLEQQPA